MSNNHKFHFDWELCKHTISTDITRGKGWRATVAADWAPIRQYADLAIVEPFKIYGDLLPLFHDSDLNIINVEAVLSDAPLVSIPKDGPALIASPASVASLKAINCHVACLANNHAMDYGTAGLESTLKALGDAEISTVGAGMGKIAIETPLFKEIKGTRLAIINCGEGESGRSLRGEPGVLGLDVGQQILQIQRMRKENLVDVIIVIFHGGREHVPVPPPYVVRELRQLAEAGVDAIVAHHPHVPQGLELHNGVPIVYSQGNFLFWQENRSYAAHTGYLVHLDFSGNSLCSLEISPYDINPEGLRLLTTEQREVFAEKMNRATYGLQSNHNINACWAAVADHVNYDGFCDFFVNTLNLSRGIEKRSQAAMKAQNRFLTPAHSAIASEVFERHAKGLRGSAEPWAASLLKEWLDG